MALFPEGTADFIEQHIKGGTFRVNEGRLDGRISQLAHMDQGTNYNALFIRATVDNGVMTFGPQVPLISAIKGGLEFRGKDFILSGLTGRFGGSPFSLDGKIADYPLATPASYPFTLSMTPAQAEVAWLLRQEKPGQMTFSGPSQLRLTGSGIAADYRLSGSWDLSRADYGFAQKLRKTAGLTNRVSFSAILGSAEARLTELHYQLPSLDVTANGVYRYDGQTAAVTCRCHQPVRGRHHPACFPRACCLSASRQAAGCRHCFRRSGRGRRAPVAGGGKTGRIFAASV